MAALPLPRAAAALARITPSNCDVSMERFKTTKLSKFLATDRLGRGPDHGNRCGSDRVDRAGQEIVAQTVFEHQGFLPFCTAGMTYPSAVRPAQPGLGDGNDTARKEKHRKFTAETDPNKMLGSFLYCSIANFQG